MKLIDLTIPLNENTPIFPGDPELVFKQIETVANDEWNKKLLTLNSHSGTHIDAPFHRFEEGKKLDEFPLEKFVGDAVCVDITAIQWDLIKEDDMVLFYTEGEVLISTEIAKQLVEKNVSIVGINAPSVDDPPHQTHNILLSKDILLLENLTNLKELVGKRFECIVAPLKLTNADGAPCRVLARVDENE